MTTPATRAIVSLVSRLAITATVVVSGLGACARNPAPATWDGTLAGRPIAFRFDNDAQTPVKVYLVSDRQEWMLGRVAPGAHATLRLPTAAFDETAGFVRLAVIPGTPTSSQGARDPRATFAIAQPSTSILSQRWTFSQRQLAAPQLFGAALPRGRR